MTIDRIKEILSEFDKWTEYSDEDLQKCANAIFNESTKETDALKEKIRYLEAELMEIQDYK